MARTKFDIQAPDLETLKKLDSDYFNQFRDPFAGLLYQFGVPTVDFQAFGDKQVHTIHGDNPVVPTTPADPVDPNDPGKVGPNPMGKFGLPKWYWQWMRTQGLSQFPLRRREDDEEEDTNQQKGLLG